MEENGPNKVKRREKTMSIDKGNDNDDRNHNANDTDVRTTMAEELNLSHAMKTADCIREKFRDYDKKEREVAKNDKSSTSTTSTSTFSSIPAGLVPGLGAMVLAGIISIPFRRLILQKPSTSGTGTSTRTNTNTADPFYGFLDMIVSTGQAIVIAQVGLYTGTIYGSNVYLKQFSSIPIHQPSTACDEICTELLPITTTGSNGKYNYIEQAKRTVSSSSSLSSWDPQKQTMIEFYKVLEVCRRRQELLEGGKKKKQGQ